MTGMVSGPADFAASGRNESMRGADQLVNGAIPGGADSSQVANPV